MLRIPKTVAFIGQPGKKGVSFKIDMRRDAGLTPAVANTAEAVIYNVAFDGALQLGEPGNSKLPVLSVLGDVRNGDVYAEVESTAFTPLTDLGLTIPGFIGTLRMSKEGQVDVAIASQSPDLQLGSVLQLSKIDSHLNVRAHMNGVSRQRGPKHTHTRVLFATVVCAHAPPILAVAAAHAAAAALPPTRVRMSRSA